MNNFFKDLDNIVEDGMFGGNEMSAKEMFEELGYELLSEKNYQIPRKSWDFNEKENSLVYFNSKLMKIIKVRIEYGYVSTILYGCGDDSDREQKQNVKLHKAIHQQMKELGWL